MMSDKASKTGIVHSARSTAESADGEIGQGCRKATELSTELGPLCSRTS